MFDRAQLRKGTLEGCILKIISREATYGYAIAVTLRESGFADLTEGTLYPLLLRLERKGLIAAEYRAGSGGPSRKYYQLTPDGAQCLAEFVAAWQTTGAAVNRILQDKEG
ncbi:PadR family transcriptional regulator [Gemmiger sp.]|jgi:transcriptional regulator, padR family|uniref:PadR family transcriptional regulator n=1 Tax=Gemmiger sp. TaxID=2049027 RepID=UPI002E79E46C|nr:PadR family transcriptional regulator [Gemmiger sp.]MED9884745.1 PadR family transcriptional regulator [Gemmiger sp.]